MAGFNFTPAVSSDMVPASPDSGNPLGSRPSTMNYGSLVQGGPGQLGSQGAGGGFGAFMQSGAGQGLLGAAGAGALAYGQAAGQSSDRKTQNAQFQQQQLLNERTLGLNQANSAMNANPLGMQQGYAQKNAMLAAILPNLRDSSHTSFGTNPVQRTGGLTHMLGPNGLDPEMIQRMYGDASTANSIAQHQNQLAAINPNVSPLNMSHLYGPDVAPAFNNVTNNYQTQMQGNAAHQQAMTDQYRAQADKVAGRSGAWGKLGKIGLMAGLGALTVASGGAAAPVTTPLMGAVIGGGTAAAGMMGR